MGPGGVRANFMACSANGGTRQAPGYQPGGRPKPSAGAKLQSVMFKNPLVKTALTVVGVLIVLKIVKPMLPAALQNWI